MKIDLSGRRVLVTGSTNGIGFAAAETRGVVDTKTARLSISRGLAKRLDGTGVFHPEVSP